MSEKPIPPPTPPPPPRVRSLAGPPVRPRYVIVSLTGYGAPADSNRKPTTTWTVLDRLNQSFPVGLDHYVWEYAEAERVEYEAAWEHYLETGVWVKPHSESRRRELRYQNGGSRYRPWCGVCKQKSRPGARQCRSCGRSLY